MTTLTLASVIRLNLQLKEERYPVRVLHAENLDYDLLKIKVERVIAEHGDQSIKLDKLTIGAVDCRASYFITTLADLKAFLDNLEAYVSQSPDKEAEQAIAEYMACYDESYHEINASAVLETLTSRVLGSKTRCQLTKEDRTNKLVEYGNKWMVILNIAA